MSSSAISNTAAGAEEIDMNFPLWKYVTVIEKMQNRCVSHYERNSIIIMNEVIQYLTYNIGSCST